MNSRLTLTASSILFLVFLSACQKQEQVVIPTGPQTLSGSLSPVELSLTRRGTHILRQNGNDLYYVESSTVNLRQFEGMDVMIHGTLEKNAESTQLPVLVADNIKLIEEPSKSWSLSALHMKMSAPITWNATLFNDGIRFAETGSSPSLMQIARSALVALPSGTPMVIGGRQAVRTDAVSGQVVYVQNAKDIVAITIDPSLSGATGKSPAQSVMRLLTSIVFTNTDTGSGGYVKFGTGAAIPTGSTACGGVAGILCPSGSFCNITDRTSGVGYCQFLKPKEQ